MTTNTRPGGLTALAIIGFILAALNIIGGLSVIFVGDAIKSLDVPTEQMTEKDRQEFEQSMTLLEDPVVKVLSGLGLVTGALLIFAGIGYLKQKKVLGRGVGNIYAIASIAIAIANLVLMPMQADAGGLSFLIGLIFPVLTIFLINVTFKEDLVH